jgi:eukaryotic-like serine/threonine-protein kinase
VTDWTPGAPLGPYVLLAQIGAGGMGEVWKARDTRLNRIVAVKRLKGHYSARFEQEARAIAALNHPHICQIHDIGPDYLVLEYIEGQSLKGPQTVEEAVRLASQIAEALDAAHRKGVVHRDLKPANIMVTSEGSVKLLDFGLAKQVSDAEATQTMAVMGTPAYMAPEQAEGKPADQRSDIFSFGAVLYEVLTGRRPFDSLAATLRDEAAPLQSPVRDIVKRCLAKQPADRYQTMGEVRSALELLSIKAVNQQPSIAVLPFANMSAEKDSEYFSDGLAEEIINALAQIPGLKVTARTSAFAFRGKEQDIQKIAEALHVKTVLEGSVRRSGNRIRVTAQLINAEDGYHLWSQRYDREMADIFDLQDEISQAIASALQVKLSGTPAAVQQYKPSLPAYEALLKARYYIGQVRPDLLPRAKECFEEAIALDPKFALAHCAYGVYFFSLVLVGILPAKQGLPIGRVQAQKALDLDPSLPDGHAMLGGVAAYLDYDWKEAEKCFRMAMARDPVPPLVRLPYAMCSLLPTGRTAEAVQQMDLALQEDPLNAQMRLYRALCLTACGRDEQAFKEYREVLEFNPAVAPALGGLAVQHLLRGELDQALALTEKAYATAPFVPNHIALLAGLLMRTGDAQRAEELLRKLQPGDAFGAPRGLAIYHWVLREFDATADWIEKGIDQHDPASVLYPRIWYGRELRSTPRWAGLMRKLNLPES